MKLENSFDKMSKISQSLTSWDLLKGGKSIRVAKYTTINKDKQPYIRSCEGQWPANRRHRQNQCLGKFQLKYPPLHAPLFHDQPRLLLQVAPVYKFCLYQSAHMPWPSHCNHPKHSVEANNKASTFEKLMKSNCDTFTISSRNNLRQVNYHFKVLEYF